MNDVITMAKIPKIEDIDKRMGDKNFIRIKGAGQMVNP